MERNFKFYPVKRDYSYFDLFVIFLPTVESKTFLIKKDPQNPDIRISDVYLWSDSLKSKFLGVSLLYQEVRNQIPIWRSNIALTKERGFGDATSQVLLLIKYETFLNSIYNLCENLSYLVKEFYPMQNLSPRFYKQLKSPQAIKNVDETYFKILGEVQWYEEVHAYRSEATHFLSGFIFISDNGEPGYQNKPYSERQGGPKSISNDNIEQHVIELYNKVCSFVTEFSKHFLLTKCNKDKPIAGFCLRRADGRTGTRTITLNDYLCEKPPTCIALEFDCPHEEECEALDKPSGRKK